MADDTVEDILFDCPACGKNLVIDGGGAGLKILCPQCQSKVTVPGQKAPPKEEKKPAPPPPPPKEPEKPRPEAAEKNPAVEKQSAAEAVQPFDTSKLDGWDDEKLQNRFKELKHLLKENTSQRTETIEYISHANLKLQRETIKLRKLETRKVEFEQELAVIAKKLNITP